MKYYIAFLCLVTFISQSLYSQNTFKAIVKDKGSKESLIGVSTFIPSTKQGGNTDLDGQVIINNVPKGNRSITFSIIGYKEKKIQVNFPTPKDTIYTVFLEESKNELEEVVVTSTRSSRNIANIPTRVEAIAAGELEEKVVMQPASIKMLLTESTGIQTQQTSQVSGSASIRIQGLDGKYTQLLEDGLPLYSEFAGGLSILQIPPLNLKGVEVIKGSSSTLYGGGAIAGLVNLITKVPTEKRELSLLFNADVTSALDASAFYSQKYGKTGLSIYTSGNLQKAYDPNKDGLSDIPQYKRYAINPTFYYYPDKNTIFSAGINAGIETRKGGDMQVLKGLTNSEHQYYEKDNSNRYSTKLKYQKTFDNKSVFTAKNTVGYFKRLIEQNGYNFDGEQLSTFSEANLMIPHENTEWNIGANYVSDAFKQLGNPAEKLNYTNSVFGLFGQNTYNISPALIMESGLRLDLTNQKKAFILPRISFLYKINSKLTSRIGGGLGYKMPTIFSEDAEEKAFQNIAPLNFKNVTSEKSYGINADLNYRTTFGEDLFFSINQMFFYTVIQKPLILSYSSNDNKYSFVNANGNMNTRGFETNAKLSFDDFSCFIGYTYTDAVRKFDHTNTANPLTSKHRINANAMYELADKLRISYELFYFGKQFLNNGDKVRDYWVMGASVQYQLNKAFTFFVNYENFLDTRQSRWGTMYTGSILNPQFKDTFAPTDGAIFNGGIRINL